MLWIVLAAHAAPPPAPAVEPVIEVVPQFRQGQVHLFMAGREGDAVFIDGFPFGNLPLTTELAEGPHTFRVEGPKGKHVIDLVVTVVPDGVAQLDLAGPPAAAAPAPATPPAPAPAAPAPK